MKPKRSYIKFKNIDTNTDEFFGSTLQIIPEEVGFKSVPIIYGDPNAQLSVMTSQDPAAKYERIRTDLYGGEVLGLPNVDGSRFSEEERAEILRERYFRLIQMRQGCAAAILARNDYYRAALSDTHKID